MSIRNTLLEILELQRSLSSTNTPEMKARGELIRNALPAEIRTVRSRIETASSIGAGDLVVEGRDGTGRKSDIPWVRFASRKLSPNARTGWYVVFLFRKDAAGVYVSLGHGSTEFEDGAFVPKPDSVLSELMDWSRKILAVDLAATPALVTAVDLGSHGDLATAYEKSCVAAFYYTPSSMPNEDALVSHLELLSLMLGKLYEADRLGHLPTVQSPEVRDAMQAATMVAKPSLSIGQGFGLSQAERKAVEFRAMEMAAEYFKANGCTVMDVSATQSFDLLVTDGGHALKVEVKGTTGGLGAILLTANEVELHRSCHPANALFVAYEIVLAKSPAPSASGGKFQVWRPWKLDDSRLSPLTYSYSP